MPAAEDMSAAEPTAQRPLDGVRVLALEQMQALPFATQLLARLGAEVVKIEHPERGDLARASFPAIDDPDGRSVGATYLRNNMSKRSICVDLKRPEGRQLVLDLAPRFDVVAENFKGGTLARLGLGYDDIAAVHPGVVYLSISGFGNTTESDYSTWPAYAAVAEAMSGLYEWKRSPGQPPMVNPVGALGDIGTSLYAVIGLLAALRLRDRTGVGQYVDLAMYDSMVTFADVVINYWSMGERSSGNAGPPMILDGMPAGGADAAGGWFVLQIGREHDFERLVRLIGTEEWLTDPRFATRAGWREHIDVIRDALTAWSADCDNVTACHRLAAAGIAAGPCHSAAQVLADEHLVRRNMFSEIHPLDDRAEPVIVPGNPIKLRDLDEFPDTRPPWLGEHTDEVLTAELGLDPDALAQLRDQGIIG